MYLEIKEAEKYRAVFYTRLSREDEANGPLGSISNQRTILEDFAHQWGVSVTGLYMGDAAILGLKSKLQQRGTSLVQVLLRAETV